MWTLVALEPGHFRLSCLAGPDVSLWLGPLAVWLDGEPHDGIWRMGRALQVGHRQFELVAPSKIPADLLAWRPSRRPMALPRNWSETVALDGVTVSGPDGERWVFDAHGATVAGERWPWSDRPEVLFNVGVARIRTASKMADVETSAVGQELLASWLRRRGRPSGGVADVPQSLTHLMRSKVGQRD